MENTPDIPDDENKVEANPEAAFSKATCHQKKEAFGQEKIDREIGKLLPIYAWFNVVIHNLYGGSQSSSLVK